MRNIAQRLRKSKAKNAELLENSYAGILGRTIEPVIKPLGYDWKIGIALITSFAAREVFIGTMATLYSVEGGKDADPQTLQRTNGFRQNRRRRQSIYSRHRCFTNDILCLRHAMHEHPGCGETRNPRLEMAPHSTRLYDGAGIRDEFDCVSTS